MTESSHEHDGPRPERRTEVRQTVDTWVVEIVNQFNLVRGRVTDRSPGGLGIRSSQPLRVGHSVSILLEVSDSPEAETEREKISLEGEVRWSRKQGETQGYRSGIEVRLPEDLTG